MMRGGGEPLTSFGERSMATTALARVVARVARSQPAAALCSSRRAYNVQGTVPRSRSSRTGALKAAWIFADSPLLTEAIATIPSLDAMIIDNQHGVGDVLPLLQAVAAGRARREDAAAGLPVAIVRVSRNCEAEIAKALDCGAEGIICPMVNSAHEAEQLVQAARFPPIGGRSFGPHRAALGLAAGTSHGDWARAANEKVALFAMIETREALGEIDDIITTAGLDGVFIGPNDLGMRLGYDPTSSPEGEVLATIEHVIARVKHHGKRAGIYCADAATARSMAERGMDLVVIGGDLGWVVGGATKALQEA